MNHSSSLSHLAGSSPSRIADSKDAKRVFGIDLCRIMAMSMIVMLHLLNHGKMLAAIPRTSMSGYLLWLLYAENYCAVDLFVLVSGWLLATKQFRPARILALAIQVYSMSVAIRLVAGFVFHFPVRWNAFFSDYWFWNSYLILVLFSPILNAGLQALCARWERKYIWALLAVLTLLLTGLPVRGIDNGYGPLWLSVPYLIGVAIRMTSTSDLSPCIKRLLPLMAVSLPGMGVASCFLCRKFGLETPVFVHPYHYNSALVLATGVCWLLFFTNLRMRSIPDVLRFASATSFGVYLIHDNPIVREALIKNRFATLGDNPLPILLAGLILSVIGIYAACMILDGVRLRLFARLRIPDRCQWVTDRFQAR